MNPAAKWVLAILGTVAVASALTLCALALRTNDGKDVKEIAVFCLGAVAGVLAKVGYEAVKDALKKDPETPAGTPDDPVSTKEVQP